VATRAPTLRATTALALASAATCGQSTVRWSVIFTNTKTVAKPEPCHLGVGILWGLGGDRRQRPSRAIPCATPAQFGCPVRRSSSSVGRQALGFHPSVAPNRSPETPSYGTRSSAPVQRRAMGLHRDGRYAGEDGEFWGSESQGNRVRLRPMLSGSAPISLDGAGSRGRAHPLPTASQSCPTSPSDPRTIAWDADYHRAGGEEERSGSREQLHDFSPVHPTGQYSKKCSSVSHVTALPRSAAYGPNAIGGSRSDDA
jgi:hypothetical protein